PTLMWLSFTSPCRLAKLMPPLIPASWNWAYKGDKVQETIRMKITFFMVVQSFLWWILLFAEKADRYIISGHQLDRPVPESIKFIFCNICQTVFVGQAEPQAVFQPVVCPEEDSHIHRLETFCTFVGCTATKATGRRFSAEQK